MEHQAWLRASLASPRLLSVGLPGLVIRTAPPGAGHAGGLPRLRRSLSDSCWSGRGGAHMLGQHTPALTMCDALTTVSQSLPIRRGGRCPFPCASNARQCCYLEDVLIMSGLLEYRHPRKARLAEQIWDGAEPESSDGHLLPARKAQPDVACLHNPHVSEALAGQSGTQRPLPHLACCLRVPFSTEPPSFCLQLC